MRIFLVSLVSIVGLFITSCGDKNKDPNTEIPLVDSTLSKLNSPELKAINAELGKNPSNPDLYYKRGQLYLSNKDFTAAIGDAKRAIKIDSSKGDYFILLCDGYFFSNQTRLAKETLEYCLKLNPASTEANLKLGEMYFYVRKYQESINYINNALKVNQTLSKGYYLKGMCYKESGDTAKAVSSFETAVEQDNNYYAAYMELGLIFANKKNPLALEYFNNALRIDPKSSEIYYDMGKFYQDMNKPKLATETYKKLLSFNPKEKNAIYNLGAIELYFNKNIEAAKKCFSDAIFTDPNYAEAYFGRGVCYDQQKDYKNAKADYEMAIQLKPNYEHAIENLNRLEGKK